MDVIDFIKYVNDPDFGKPKPCMMSGLCCTTAPCGYGEWNDDKSACRFLLAPDSIGRRKCEKYDWIKENVPDWEIYPAFGAGCCMPIGNMKRLEIIKKLQDEKK